MFAGKPIIGIVGGIGSGKSFVAKLFGEMGCLVIDSDEQVREVYTREDVKQKLREWWGDSVIATSGEIDRRAVAAKVFSDENERRKLEGLIHPLVAAARDREMMAAADDSQILAFVWDTPLLLEAGLERECDAIVFVDSPQEIRQKRVSQQRGWDGAELLRREKSQSPLDRKREISDYTLSNAADADFVRGQVREVLSRILTRFATKP